MSVRVGGRRLLSGGDRGVVARPLLALVARPAPFARPALVALAALVALVGIAALLAALGALAGCDGNGAGAPPEGVVRTAGGLVSGVEAVGVRAYLGIPYAAPPVGDLRWRPPQPVAPWGGVRRCTSYGPACPQPGGLDAGVFPVGETAEDCLYLNVWTPAVAPPAAPADGVEAGSETPPAGVPRLPVMVWVHGGGFATGSGSLPMYSGARLARLGAVVVTVNYRLGVLGFLAHPSLTGEDGLGTSGNYGLLDQVAALEWVRDNIAAFGGDPGNVTVFGESAGGMSVCDLMVSPRAEGLFARAIVQSGPFDARGAGMDAVRSLAEAEATGKRLSRLLGCADEPDELAALRAVPARRLVEAAERAAPRIPGGIGFGPVVDGVVLPGEPAALFADGMVHDVDLLVGANADEANLFLLGMRDRAPAQLAAFVRRLYEPYAAEVLAHFPPAAYGSRTAALSKAVTVMGFLAPARFAAAAVARAGGDAYLYHFARRPPAAGDLGAFHGLEIPYVFGNPALTLDVTSGADGELSRAMMRYWVSFARAGDPNGGVAAGAPEDAAGEPLPRWPRYDPATDRCLVFDVPVRAAPAPFAAVCDLADRLRARRIAAGLD